MVGVETFRSTNEYSKHCRERKELRVLAADRAKQKLAGNAPRKARAQRVDFPSAYALG